DHALSRTFGNRYDSEISPRTNNLVVDERDRTGDRDRHQRARHQDNERYDENPDESEEYHGTTGRYLACRRASSSIPALALVGTGAPRRLNRDTLTRRSGLRGRGLFAG